MDPNGNLRRHCSTKPRSIAGHCDMDPVVVPVPEAIGCSRAPIRELSPDRYCDALRRRCIPGRVVPLSQALQGAVANGLREVVRSVSSTEEVRRRGDISALRDRVVKSAHVFSVPGSARARGKVHKSVDKWRLLSSIERSTSVPLRLSTSGTCVTRVACEARMRIRKPRWPQL